MLNDDLLVRATFRFTEGPAPRGKFKTKVFDWWAQGKELFPGPK